MLLTSHARTCTPRGSTTSGQSLSPCTGTAPGPASPPCMVVCFLIYICFLKPHSFVFVFKCMYFFHKGFCVVYFTVLILFFVLQYCGFYFLVLYPSFVFHSLGTLCCDPHSKTFHEMNASFSAGGCKASSSPRLKYRLCSPAKTRATMVCMHIGNNPDYSESLELGKSYGQWGPSILSNTIHRTPQENLESRKSQKVPFWGPPGDSACCLRRQVAVLA